MIYVLSDVHGQAEAFFDIIEQIKFTDEDELYILGDIVDRGPKAFEVFDFIDTHPNVYLLMGNHEKMMLDFIRSVDYKIDYNNNRQYSFDARYYYQLWMGNGGGVTYDQLLSKDKKYQEHFIETLKELPYYKKIEVNGKRFLLCHARPIFYENLEFDENLEYLIKEEEIVWCRETMPQHIPDNYMVIHGHSPVQYRFGENEIVKYSYGEILDIDCGCAGCIRLACLRLDDMQEFYSEKMVIQK